MYLWKTKKKNRQFEIEIKTDCCFVYDKDTVCVLFVMSF